MATLQPEQINDLILTAQRNLGKKKFTPLALNLQKYPAYSHLLREKKITFSSGHGIQWNVMKNHSGHAKTTGLFATNNVNVEDVMAQANIPWRMLTTDYAIEDREIIMNTGAEQIVELVKVRRIDAISSYIALSETLFWAQPTLAQVDATEPYGLRSYLVKATGTPAFSSSVTSGWTTIAALDPATVTNWRPWAGGYTLIDRTDLIRKMREAAVKTVFENPAAAPSYGGNPTLPSSGYYMPYTVLQGLEEAAEAQNDRLGNDLASRDGKTLFRGNELVWVPELDSTATGDPGVGAPVYGINWNEMMLVFLKGEFMNESKAFRPDLQHRTSRYHVDTSYNLRCTDQRRQFVLATAVD